VAAMLTTERIAEVRRTLAILDEAGAAVEALLDAEGTGQPPTDRATAIRWLAREVDRIAAELEALFA
jgi:hypothetical protein